jgi:CDP-diacylglycerol---serine O-phosphatidyltransferase
MDEPDPLLRNDAGLRPRRKGLYVLPNAISLAALFAAFYAIVMAMNSRFEAASTDGWRA